METLGKINVNSAQAIYTSLQDSEIRMLTLLPGGPTSPIHCTLEVVNLSNHPPYTALSYVWGKFGNTFPTITLNNQPYAITQNLHVALTHFRSPLIPLRLWIDALCINQCSPSERSVQVNLMHLIFANATKVAAWLGSLDHFERMLNFSGGTDTHLLFPLIRKAETHNFRVSWMRTMIRKHSTKIFSSLADLLFREFWTRVWITQEIADTNKVVLVIGNESAAMQSVLRFLRAIVEMGEAVDERVRAIALKSITETFAHVHALGEREPWVNAPSFMHRIIYLTNGKHATDKRDLFFGIRNLLPERMRACIEVDYTKSVGEVYADATKRFIDLEGAMDCLLWRPYRFEQSEVCEGLGIPGWAISMLEENKMPTGECALGSMFRASGEFPAFYRIDGRELETRGYKMGVIKSRMLDQLSRDKDMAFRFTALVKQARKWTKETLWPCDSTLVDQETFAMTVLCGGWSWLVERVRRGVFEEMTEISDVDDRRLGETIMPLSGREYFTFEPTAVGTISDQAAGFKYMGLACNQWAFPGDIICVLLGFKTPVILKPTGDKYELVGDAYVRHYMDGQVMEEYGGDPQQLERFVIV